MYILLFCIMSDTKKRRGAPFKSVKADKMVLIRVTEEQRDHWRAAAQKDGIKLSAWIKKKCGK